MGIWLCSLLSVQCSVSDSSRGRRTPRLKFSDRSRRPLSFKMTKKKGFMTPERKKKLRTLLRKKAAEELKKEQERKATERQRIIAERCGIKKDIDNASDTNSRKSSKSTLTSGSTWKEKCSFCNAKSFSAISRSMSLTCPSAT